MGHPMHLKKCDTNEKGPALFLVSGAVTAGTLAIAFTLLAVGFGTTGYVGALTGLTVAFDGTIAAV